MKNTLRSNLTAGFLGLAALVSTSASALANADWYPKSPPKAPEVGTWLIGAAIIALLGLDFVRRRFARGTKASVS